MQAAGGCGEIKLFEETLGNIGYWAVVFAFLVGCFLNDFARLLGYGVGTLLLIIWFVRDFFTLSSLDNGGYLAASVVVFLVCYLGKLHAKGRLK
jgi:hypothetical protein